MENLSLNDRELRGDLEVVNEEAKMCAAVEEISGCQCIRSRCDPNYQISCSGETVTQETLVSLIRVLRQVKGQENGWLNIKTLHITNTNLVELDLSPLTKVRFGFLSISNNKLLRWLKGPPLDKPLKDEDFIHAQSLHISFNPLMTDQGFGNTLKYFSPTLLYDLNLWGMRLQGSLGSGFHKTAEGPVVGEFLPGLSTFKGLQGLELAMNDIRRIGGGQFRSNNKLSFLNLRKNDIEQIQRDAFAFDEIDPEDDFFKREYQTLVIGLDECQLTSDTFVDNELEWTKQRAIHLDMWTNQFETLPASVFENFLDTHPNNEIIVSDNPLVRDERLNWLINQKDKFKSRVHLSGPNSNGFIFIL